MSTTIEIDFIKPLKCLLGLKWLTTDMNRIWITMWKALFQCNFNVISMKLSKRKTDIQHTSSLRSFMWTGHLRGSPLGGIPQPIAPGFLAICSPSLTPAGARQM